MPYTVSDEDIIEQARLEKAVEDAGKKLAADPTHENLQAHNRIQAQLCDHRSKIAVENFGPNGGMTIIAE